MNGDIHPLKEYKGNRRLPWKVNTMTSGSITLIEQTGLDQHVAPFPKPHMEGFENPDRLRITLQYLEENNALADILTLKTPRATCDEALIVHSPYLVHSVELMSELGSGQLGESAYASESLLSTTLYALGGALLAADLVLSGSTEHTFALIRPPGHHATSSATMGLCFFNNVAIAARTILQEDNVDRVTILDIDDHFGNGTAEVFYTDPKVQFISIHEYDYVSFGLGHYRETGRNKGEGTNINIPLYEGAPDSSYRAAMTKIVAPAIESFQPDMIAVSAGYDGHYTDPIGDMALDSRTYWFIAHTIRNLVESLGIKGSFWVLEGGYNPLVLGPCVRSTIEGLKGDPLPTLEDQTKHIEDEDVVKKNKRVLNRVWRTVSQFL